VIVCFDPVEELLVVVCWVCSHALLTADASQGSFVWELMKDTNNR
jgi:hypothetical protein